MVRNTIPTLIRYGKYKMPHRDDTPHKFSTLTTKQFNRCIFAMGVGVVAFTGSVYVAMYYSYSYKRVLFKSQLVK